MKNKINISDKELDRDIVNLHLPEIDMIPDFDADIDADDPSYSKEDNEMFREARRKRRSGNK